MLKQMQKWQNTFTITLILMCVGIGLGHNIEAATASDHGEHCSICVFGNSTPAIFNEAASLELNIAAPRLKTPSLACGYRNHVWPDYTTRAPPLV